MQRVDGGVAVITGGLGHVGQAAANGLAELGANIVLVDLTAATAASAAAVGRLEEQHGVRVTCIEADLESDRSAPEVVDAVLADFGRLDVLVNCAAFVGTTDLAGWAVPFAEQSPATFQRSLNTNLVAPFALAQAASEALRKSSLGGSIVNVSSIYGQVGPDMRLYEGTTMGNPAGYAASKGGLEQLTRWMATVLAPDIRVNAVASGGLERGQAPEFVTRYVERTPLARMGSEEDLVGAIAFLASPLSGYVTGQVLTVDGGWTAW